MVSIRQPSDSGSGGTKDVNFIQYIDGRDPQIQKRWCLGSDGVTCKTHLAAQIEVGSGTVGQFTINELDENGKNYINGSVVLLGIPNFI